MIKAYLDTNVIVRFLVDDPPEMAEKAARLFEAAEQGEVALVVDVLVIAEVIWVLKSFYNHTVPAIAKTLGDFILGDGIFIDDRGTLLVALHLYETKHIDFIDAWLAATMQRRGIKQIFSFDTHFDRVVGIQRLEPDRELSL